MSKMLLAYLLLSFSLAHAGQLPNSFNLSSRNIENEDGIPQLTCGKKLNTKNVVLKKAYQQLDISTCKVEKIAEQIAAVLVPSQNDFDDITFAASSEQDIVAFLETDHREGDGSAPYTTKKLAEVKALMASPDAFPKPYLGELMDNYMSGTGITGLVVIFSKNLKTVTIITKFQYAE